MIVRRHLIVRLAGVLLGIALGVAWAPDARANEAAAFLESLKDQAIQQLTDPAVPEEERKKRFRTLFRENFDLPAIGRFVLGRYWPAAGEAERQEFLAVFEDVLVKRFAPEFAGYGETKFEVTNVRPVKEEGQVLISTTITPPQGEVLQVDWRLRRTDGGFQVLDVIGQGVSMALTLRSEYAAVIKQSGGRIDGLIATLRERVQSAG